MKKKFTDLNICDIVYRIEPNTIEVKEFPITEISKNSFIIGINSKIARVQNEIMKGKVEGYSTNFIFFANKEDAIRYSRAQCTKIVFQKIEGLKKALNDAIDFKKQYYDLLGKWMEPDFDKLEKEINKL